MRHVIPARFQDVAVIGIEGVALIGDFKERKPMRKQAKWVELPDIIMLFTTLEYIEGICCSAYLPAMTLVCTRYA